MSPKGVEKGSKQERRYKDIVKSEKKEDRSTKHAKEIAKSRGSRCPDCRHREAGIEAPWH